MSKHDKSYIKSYTTSKMWVIDVDCNDIRAAMIFCVNGNLFIPRM